MSVPTETSIALSANEAYVAAFTPEKASLAMPPARKLAVVVCMGQCTAARSTTDTVSDATH